MGEKQVLFQSEETVLEINKCTYPVSEKMD